MAKKIAENVFIKGENRGLRKSYDARTEIHDLSGPVTAIPHFGYIIPGLEGMVYAILVETNPGEVWLAFFLDGTSGPNHKGELDGLYVLENGEELETFSPYFYRSFHKIHGRKQIEKLRKIYSGEEEPDDESPTLDLS